MFEQLNNEVTLVPLPIWDVTAFLGQNVRQKKHGSKAWLLLVKLCWAKAIWSSLLLKKNEIK
jgi:hypothetical protein